MDFTQKQVSDILTQLLGIVSSKKIKYSQISKKKRQKKRLPLLLRQPRFILI